MSHFTETIRFMAQPPRFRLICNDCLRLFRRRRRPSSRLDPRAGIAQYATVSRRPFRLGIIGSGPAGFYAAARILRRMQDVVIDMYEQLPTPFGLVRYGVAPDHPEVKVRIMAIPITDTQYA